MAKRAEALLILSAAGFAAFVAVCLGPETQQWTLVATLAGGAAFPFIVASVAVFVAERRFGLVPSGLPGLLGAIVLIAAGIFLYSRILRSVSPDEGEPNLVFIFAPMALMILSIVVSSVVVGWSWRRRRGRAA